MGSGVSAQGGTPQLGLQHVLHEPPMDVVAHVLTHLNTTGGWPGPPIRRQWVIHCLLGTPPQTHAKLSGMAPHSPKTDRNSMLSVKNLQSAVEVLWEGTQPPKPVPAHRLRGWCGYTVPTQQCPASSATTLHASPRRSLARISSLQFVILPRCQSKSSPSKLRGGLPLNPRLPNTRTLVKAGYGVGFGEGD